jgi:hypothetical protein
VFPFRDATDYWQFLCTVAGAIAGVLERLEDDERARVREEITASLPSPGTSGEIELQALSLVASAT